VCVCVCVWQQDTRYVCALPVWFLTLEARKARESLFAWLRIDRIPGETRPVGSRGAIAAWTRMRRTNNGSVQEQHLFRLVSGPTQSCVSGHEGGLAVQVNQ